MAKDLIGYDGLVQESLRGVMAGVLGRVARSGLPGDHHFYIGFRTAHPGVAISPALRERYPVEMTVVLQHRYSGLEVDDSGFAVTLSFGGVAERLSVPFEAVTVFADPSVEFALRFEGGAIAPAGAGEKKAGDGAEDLPESAGTGPSESQATGPADVVSLDSFRGSGRTRRDSS